MSEKKKPNRPDQRRTSTHPPGGGPPRGAPVSGTEEVPRELVESIDLALHDPHPLALLSMASGIIAACDPRLLHMAGHGSGESPTLAEVCESFDRAGMRQTDALLKVIAAMTGDDLLRERIRRSVAARRHAIPGWVLRLDQVHPVRAVEMLHVLRDGDNIVIGVDLPGKRALSILVYIDHNMGTVVKDAFTLEVPVDNVADAWHELLDANGAAATDTEILDLSLADARARIIPAIDQGAITFPPFETDTWPACRPLVEWIVSMLPADGADYVRPAWDEDRLAELTEAFFASELGRPLDDDDHRSLLEAILSFGTDYGPGDPLRWSSVAIEILLIDWIPRKLIAPADYLAKAPELLRALIGYAHAERGIRPALREETLLAVDEWEPAYLKAIRTPRHQGAMALLDGIGALEGADPEPYDGLINRDYFLAMLASEVGGPDELDRLDGEPLPDEPFDWTGIPADIHERVAGIVRLVDGCSDELFDIEIRTASRRFLSRVAAADPGIFRGKSLARTIAATVCWVVGRANDSFDPSVPSPVTVKTLMAHFGVGGSLPKRAEPMLRALGISENRGWFNLGDPDLLAAGRRAQIIAERDYYRAAPGDFDDD